MIIKTVKKIKILLHMYNIAHYYCKREEQETIVIKYIDGVIGITYSANSNEAYVVIKKYNYDFAELSLGQEVIGKNSLTEKLFQRIK